MEARILVFKTNIQSKTDVGQILSHFNEHPAIIRWNVDLEDVDNILRIESPLLKATDIIKLVREAGYACEELPD